MKSHILRDHGHVVFDVETTGLHPRRGDRIIEIGAVVMRAGVIHDEFHSLVNVRRKISKGAQQVHGITDEMLVGEPAPDLVYPRFQAFIKDSILVAHNARFDMTFLRSEFHRLGLSLAARYMCTLEMSRKCFPHLADHSLTSVYRFLFGTVPQGIQMHRALNDARMTAEIWLKMTGVCSERQIAIRSNG